MGESSVGFDLAQRPDLANRIAALSRLVNAEIVVNVDARRSDQPGIYKSSVPVGPDGPTGQRYDKMRLVRSASTYRHVPYWAGPPPWAGRPARTAGAAPSRW